MNKQRTGIDFSKHELHIVQNDGVLIHHLKKPNTNSDNIKYINAGGILAVTGDYGNWIFCREFHPSASGSVSDSYWREKLHILSTQESQEFDSDATEKELKSLINGGYKEYGFEEHRLEEMVEYAEGCLNNVNDSEEDYRYYAYKNLPSFSDYESIVLINKTKFWLLAVFDGFEEICNRIKQ